jgi:hypothetical protein
LHCCPCIMILPNHEGSFPNQLIAVVKQQPEIRNKKK